MLPKMGAARCCKRKERYMKKRLFSLLALFISAVMFSTGFTVFGEYTYTCDYMYSILETADAKKFYDALYESCETVDNSSGNYNYTPYVYYPSSLTFSQAEEITFIFSQDHPEYFWLSSTYRYTSKGNIAFKVLPDFTSGTVRQQAKKAIEETAQEYIDGAMKYSTEYERAEYLHNMLIKNVSYETGDWDQTIASVFLQGKTVCAGYSKAYELLCNAVGIDTIVLTSVNHAWNAINISGMWFLVDVTNDYNSMKYFLISDSRMAQLDRASGVTYTVTEIVNGEKTEYTFHLHDIDYTTYITYYDDFPECTVNYTDVASTIPTQQIVYNDEILGDANLDGLVNVRDASYIAKMIVQGRASSLPLCADYNMDQVINIRDAAALASALVRRTAA